MFELDLQYEFYFASAQLMLTMFGMGATLRPRDFAEVLRSPAAFALGLGWILGVGGADAVTIGIETAFRNTGLAILIKASVLPAIAGVADPFADQVLFVALLYGGFAIAVSLPTALVHRRLSAS
jgi:hypothetical protein